jgi:hypothetical protein
MTEQQSRKPGFLYRRGGNLLFFGLQALIVLGIVLFVVNISDDKQRLPKSRDASFGDEVLVADNSVGCPTEEIYERWLNTALEKGRRERFGGGSAGRLPIDQQRHQLL